MDVSWGWQKPNWIPISLSGQGLFQKDSYSVCYSKLEGSAKNLFTSPLIIEGFGMQCGLLKR